MEDGGWIEKNQKMINDLSFFLLPWMSKLDLSFGCQTPDSDNDFWTNIAKNDQSAGLAWEVIYISRRRMKSLLYHITHL